jgi:hypothetical protein
LPAIKKEREQARNHTQSRRLSLASSNTLS